MSALSSQTLRFSFWKFFPFWMFLVFLKFGSSLHFSLFAPFGERFSPLWLVGLLIGGCAFFQLVFDVPAGYLLDRYGYRKLLKLTTIFFLIAMVFFMIGLTQATFLLSVFFATFGWLFFGPGVDAYMLSQAKKEIAGRFISFRDIFGAFGVVLASASLTFVLLLDVEIIGLILFALIAIAWIMITLSPKDRELVHKETKIETRLSPWKSCGSYG